MALYSLPPDLLRPILFPLSAINIGHLWLSGDKTLQYLIGTAGGVEDFELDFAHTWPRLVSHIRLKSFKITLPDISNGAFWFTKGIDISTLPRTLQNLELNIPNALSHIALLLDGNSSPFLFPELTRLVFAPQYPPKFDRKKFMSLLPKTLTVLRIPGVTFDIDSVLCLPCVLKELELAVVPVTEKDEVRFRDFTSFQQLETFILHGSVKMRFSMVPPSVLDFTWHIFGTNERHYVTKSASNIDHAFGTIPSLAGLPKGLTRLSTHF